MDLEFFLAKPVPLPTEIRPSMDCVQGVGVDVATDFWTTQLSEVRETGADAEKYKNDGAI